MDTNTAGSHGTAPQGLETPVEATSVPPKASSAVKKAPKRKKNPSRNDRRDEAAGEVENAADLIDTLVEEVRQFVVEQTDEEESEILTEQPSEATLADWEERLGSAEGKKEDAKSVWEDLKDEIDAWKDGMPENLQGGSKYEELDECSNEMDSAIQELDNEDFPSLPNGDVSKTEWEEFADSLDTLAQSLRSAAETAQNAHFPGMR